MGLLRLEIPTPTSDFPTQLLGLFIDQHKEEDKRGKSSYDEETNH